MVISVFRQHRSGRGWAHTHALEARRLLSSPELDLTFGEGGIAPLNAFSGDFFVVKPLADGKILAAGAGSSKTQGGWEPLVARFNADGTSDTSFDGDGVLFLPQDLRVVGACAAAIAPDGKIAILYYRLEQPELRIFRFNADGTIDSSFGTNGVASVITPLHPRAVLGQSIAVQPDGKIVFSFAEGFGTVRTPYLLRLNADGSIDNGYRGGLANLTPAPGAVGDLAVGPDGKVYATGTAPLPEGADFVQGAIARYNTNGTLDTTFGDDGFAVILDPVDPHAIAPPNAVPESIAFDGSGRILVNSRIDNVPDSAHQTVFLARFTTRGVRDRSFGSGDGLVDLGPTYRGPAPTHMVVTPDGKITGAIDNFNESGFTVFRVTPDGTFDTTFGQGGKVEPPREVMDVRHAMNLDANGNVLLAGQAVEPYFLAVTRLVPDSPDVHLNRLGHLFIEGTSEPDTIEVERQLDQLIVHRNGSATPFSYDSVKMLNVFPSAGDDVIVVRARIRQGSTLSGGAGDDRIRTGNGTFAVDGGDGNDTIGSGDGDHLVDLGLGEDRLTTRSGNDTIKGGGGSDTITTGDGDDSIVMGSGFRSGDDSITTGGGNDTIYVGDGDDTVHAGDGNDLIQAEPTPDPDDELGNSDIGGTGNRSYFGDDGDDTITAGNGTNQIFGGAGDDSIIGGIATDTISGGDGNDMILDDRGGTTDFGTPVTSDDSIHGDRGDDTLLSGWGNDTLIGDAGDDSLDGGDGDDSLWAGDGNDQAYGDFGNDTLKGGNGDDTLHGGTGNDLIWGHAGMDFIRGAAGDDSISGGTENDRLYGNAGRDNIDGGDGRDRLFGDDDNDILTGDSGSDIIDGGAGRDRMAGVVGNDAFHARDGFADTVEGGDGVDVILDRDPGSLDQVIL